MLDSPSDRSSTYSEPLPSAATSPSIPALRLQIVRLAWPICVAIAVGALAQLIIAALLGHMSEEALYIRSVFIPLTFLVLAVLEGFDVATQVGLARLNGEQQSTAGLSLPGSSAKLIGHLIVGACATLGSLALLVTILAPTLANVLGVPEKFVDDFLWFARWTVLASVVSAPAGVMAAALRGWGRTGSAAAVSLLVATIQVLAVWVIGQICGQGVDSVPIAILVSALVGAAVAWILLMRIGLLGTPLTRSRAVSSRTVGALRVRRLVVGIGLPVGLSYFLLALTSFAIMWILAPFGTHVVAGYGAAAIAQTVIVVPAIGLAAATSIVMNQQWGAGELTSLPRTFRSGLGVVFAVYLVVGVCTFAAASPVSRLLSDDSTVAVQSALYLSVVGPSYLCTGLMLYLVTLLEQLGYGIVAVALNLIYVAASLGFGGMLAASGGGPIALYMTIAIANAAGLVVLLIVSFDLIRRRSNGLTRATTGGVL